MNYLAQLHTNPNKQLTFGNYFNSQFDAINLQAMDNDEIRFTIFSGKSGSGVTHLLHALCNDYLSQEKKKYLHFNPVVVIHCLLIKNG